MYQIESRVRYSECDEYGNLSPLALINYLQDCTTFHSEDIGRGVDYMGARHIAWLIAAWQIEIDRLPRFCENITVRTWNHSMTRTLADRDFEVLDAEGTPIVRAESLWFVFDFKAGRPIRIPDDQRIYLTDEPRIDMPPTPRKIAVEGAGQEAPAIVVTEGHLDTNRHVNNAQYLGMAIDTLAAAYAAQVDPSALAIRRICIQYQRQAVLGDVIVPRMHVQDDHRYTVELAAQDGPSYAIVQLTLGAAGAAS